MKPTTNSIGAVSGEGSSAPMARPSQTPATIANAPSAMIGTAADAK
jgi:hypothetical protein